MSLIDPLTWSNSEMDLGWLSYTTIAFDDKHSVSLTFKSFVGLWLSCPLVLFPLHFIKSFLKASYISSVFVISFKSLL